MRKVLKLEKGGTWKADHLASVADKTDLGHAQRTHDDHVAIIIAAVRRRAAREAGIGGLHNDDFVRRNAGPQYLPLLDETAWSNNHQRRPGPEPKAGTIGTCSGGARQHMARPDDLLQCVEKASIVELPISCGVYRLVAQT